MATISNKSFIIPVAFVTAAELELILKDDQHISATNDYDSIIFNKNTTTYRARATSEELENIKFTVRKYLEYKFFQMKDISKMLTSDQLLAIHTNIYKSIFDGHINNISYLSPLKNKSINSMTYDQLLEVHLKKLKETYNLHNNMFNCDVLHLNSPKITDAQLIEKSKKDALEIDSLFKKIVKKYNEITINQLQEIHEDIFKTLLNLHIENTECFSEIKQYGINNLSYEQIIKLHLDDLKETFKLHVNMILNS